MGQSGQYVVQSIEAEYATDLTLRQRITTDEDVTRPVAVELLDHLAQWLPVEYQQATLPTGSALQIEPRVMNASSVITHAVAFLQTSLLLRGIDLHGMLENTDQRALARLMLNQEARTQSLGRTARRHDDEGAVGLRRNLEDCRTGEQLHTALARGVIQTDGTGAVQSHLAAIGQSQAAHLTTGRAMVSQQWQKQVLTLVQAKATEQQCQTGRSPPAAQTGMTSRITRYARSAGHGPAW